MEAKSLVILGRQPAIGLAELESLYGTEALQPVGQAAVIINLPHSQVDFNRLGGSIKLAKVLTQLTTSDWPKIEKYLRQGIPDQLQYVPEGKFTFGLSAFGFDISPAKLNASALTLKKAIRATGRSVRVVPNKELALNSAQVLHNGLTTPTGWELLLVRDGNHTWLAQTVTEQDIDAYAARDQGRPKRDAKVGMLPPKLAQTIVNLAAATTEPSTEKVILDPFCGTGVILQEATLMGFGVYGSDVDERMVQYTDKNLMWLVGQPNMPVYRPVEAEHDKDWRYFKLETGDATTHTWEPAPFAVACEGYLGQPFNTFPAAEKLAEVQNTCNTILKKFLKNISKQIPAGTRLCLAVPAWQQKPGRFSHLATLDHLEELGYNRVSFKHAHDEDLIYARADQIVARDLLVLIKK